MGGLEKFFIAVWAIGLVVILIKKGSEDAVYPSTWYGVAVYISYCIMYTHTHNPLFRD